MSILGIGFAQGLYAIDAADGETEHGALVVNALIQALLQFVYFELSGISEAWNLISNFLERLTSIRRSPSKSALVIIFFTLTPLSVLQWIQFDFVLFVSYANVQSIMSITHEMLAGTL